MYSVPGGQKLDLSLGAEDDLKETELTRRAVNYSYKDGEAFVFMDSEDYTQYTLDSNVVGDAAGYLVDGIEGCYVQIIDDAGQQATRHGGSRASTPRASRRPTRCTPTRASAFASRSTGCPTSR